MIPLANLLKKKKIYLIIPIVILVIYAFGSIVLENFIFDPTAFNIYYNAGNYIFTNPEILYTGNFPLPYFYLPSFATVFSMFSLIPYSISQWMYFITLLLFSILTVIKFDRILQLKNVNDIVIRFIFLLIIVNGFRIYNTFDWLQSKFIVLYLFLLFLERELKYKDSEKYDTIIFQFIQLNILVFTIGMIPFFVFLLIFYFFDDIKRIFTIKFARKVILFILVFLIQNFMFIVYPILIPTFIEGITYGNVDFPSSITILDILNSTFRPPVDSLSTIYCLLNIFFDISFINFTAFYISLLFIISITLILTFKKTLSIDQKFGYFMLSSLITFTFIYPRTLIVILPLILLLFSNGISDSDKNGEISNFKGIYSFLNRNKCWVLGLLCITVLNFLIPYPILLRDIPILQLVPIPILLLVNPVLHSILLFTIYTTLIKKNKSIL